MYFYKDDFSNLSDSVITLQCPHCSVNTTLTLISVPSYYLLVRYKPNKAGFSYMCNSCKEPVFLKFGILGINTYDKYIHLNDFFHEIEFAQIPFDFEFIPEIVKVNFSEALKCYSFGAYNAFASMCRRTIQSLSTDLGASGKDKIQKQINDLKGISNLDDETFDILKQIILDGHDGAHPHLPELNIDRAKILLELIQDILYQIYIRKGKLNKASELRKKQIKNK